MVKVEIVSIPQRCDLNACPALPGEARDASFNPATVRFEWRTGAHSVLLRGFNPATVRFEFLRARTPRGEPVSIPQRCDLNSTCPE